MLPRATIFATLVVLAACSAPQPSSAPASRNVAAMQAALAGALGEPALVEFYTTDCESCRAIRAPMGVLDQQYDGKVKFNVRGVPTIALLDRHGRAASNIAGWPGEQAITDALTALAAR